MKNILIVCVNFNSYDELNKYLDSIELACVNANGIAVQVVVADNSTAFQKISTDKYKHITVEQSEQKNLGYLLGATNVINKIQNICEYDFVVISNVDLEVDESFFLNLEKMEFEEDVAWVATKIWSEQEDRDKNPKIIERYSKEKLNKIRMLYKYPILDLIYTNTLYLRKKVRPHYQEQDIYAGHGSFMMLTKRFFKEYPKIDYPLFLFGEEMFLAELARKKNLKVRYVPDLVVIDKEHTSTSKMKKKAYYDYNLKSIDYILDTFYE